MTIDRDRLHALADEAGRGHVQLSGGMLAGLLDALTRAEAQSAIRGRAVAIYQQRAREAKERIQAVEDALDGYTKFIHVEHIRAALEQRKA